MSFLHFTKYNNPYPLWGCTHYTPYFIFIYILLARFKTPSSVLLVLGFDSLKTKQISYRLLQITIGYCKCNICALQNTTTQIALKYTKYG